jgi:type II secretory pathway pseudopilin PulG
MKKNQSGFSILEIIVMVVVLGVVGVITVPKFKTMLHQSREGRTKSGLGELRGALAIYYSDNFGLYPSDEAAPDHLLHDVLVPKYLKKIPAVDLTHIHPGKARTVQNELNDKGDWFYTTLDGFVGVNCTHEDTKGVVISNW